MKQNSKFLICLLLLFFILCFAAKPLEGKSTYLASESDDEYLKGKISGKTISLSGKVLTNTKKGSLQFIKYKQKTNSYTYIKYANYTFSVRGRKYSFTFVPSKKIGKLSDGFYQISVSIAKGKQYIIYCNAKKGKLSFYQSDGSKQGKLALKFINAVGTQKNIQKNNENQFINSSSKQTSSKKQFSDLKKFTDRLCKKQKTDYNKAKTIYNWIVKNIYYNGSIKSTVKNGNNNAYYVFKKRYAVCEGYVRLFTEMLATQDIPAVHITGTGNGGLPVLNAKGLHAWAAVYADHRWFLADPTWDSGNVYKGKKKGFSKGNATKIFFDMAPDAFHMTHKALNIETGDILNDIKISFINGRVTAMFYQGNKTKVIYPDKYKGLAITAINSTRLKGNFQENVKTVIVPEGYKVLDEYAFQYYCGMSRLELPKSIYLIKKGMCFNSKNITTVYAGKDFYAYKKSIQMGYQTKQKGT